METLWLALLGTFFAGYFVLGGYDYGVGMLLPVVGRDDRERRQVLNALGPFFLGNEVWLIAAAGVLFGAFPLLEGRLLSGLYPFVVTILVGLVVGNAAVQLRSRHSGAAGRRFWDGLVVAGGLVPALAWGAAVGAWLRGVPVDAGGHVVFGLTDLVNPVVAAWAAAVAALFTAHGAAFLALRLPGEFAERAREHARRLTVLAGAAVVLAMAVSVASPRVRSVADPLLAAPLAVVVVALLAAARNRLAARRPGWAFAGTSVAAAGPLLLVAAALHPYLLVSSVGESANLTAGQAAADPATLALLGAFAIPLVPVIAAYQFWSWWAFRGRLDGRSLTYF
ncbi:MAG: cytochrome d ubiquinol oxidase subunit II [Streptosporangiales bacterium]|nr:cytochrome d ubiquinol oxidase subunit II [Streptosporangiales bacterium]